MRARLPVLSKMFARTAFRKTDFAQFCAGHDTIRFWLNLALLRADLSLDLHAFGC